MKPRRFLLKYRRKRPRGFTLIELLVGMILTFLVLAPLIGVAVNILQGDKAEQAKATTEQEMQAALDYIARDLQQAVYIYTPEGITRNLNINDSTQSGIKNQIPPVAPAPGCTNASTCVPILAFWKREIVKEVEEQKIEGVNPFVYALVVYYHITGPQSASDNNIWSKASRIGRFEIKDGVRLSSPPTNPSDSPYYNDSTAPFKKDDGFRLFDLSQQGGNLDRKMNIWAKDGPAYTNPVAILVDYVDQSRWKEAAGDPAPICPLNPTTNPPVPLSRNPASEGDVKGFFACIDSSKWVAQVFIRGNSVFRRDQNCDPTKSECKFSQNNAAFFPRATVQVRGQGFLDTL